MQTRRLGRTGLEVTVVGFGALTIGGAFGAVDDAVSTAALHAAQTILPEINTNTIAGIQAAHRMAASRVDSQSVC